MYISLNMNLPTKFELMSALFCRADNPVMFLYMGNKYTLDAIEREDGGGHCYNLVLRDIVTHVTLNKFVRTKD